MADVELHVGEIRERNCVKVKPGDPGNSPLFVLGREMAESSNECLANIHRRIFSLPMWSTTELFLPMPRGKRTNSILRRD